MIIACPHCSAPTTRPLCHSCSNPRAVPSLTVYSVGEAVQHRQRTLRQLYSEALTEEVPKAIKELLERLS